MTPRRQRAITGVAIGSTIAFIIAALLLASTPSTILRTTTTTQVNTITQVSSSTVTKTTTSLSTATVTSVATTTETTTSVVPPALQVSYLTVDSNGSYFVDTWAGGVQLSYGLTNTSLAVVRGQQFVVGAFDNSCFRFNHWSSGSADRFLEMSITQNTTIYAYYTDICKPAPLNFADLNVSTVDSHGEITGIYVTLFEGGNVNATCFSPCSFEVPHGIYVVSVSDFAPFSFQKWSDGLTTTAREVSVSGNVTLTALYGGT